MDSPFNTAHRPWLVAAFFCAVSLLSSPAAARTSIHQHSPTWGDMTVLNGHPRMYMLDNFVSGAEIAEILSLADASWEVVSPTHKTCLLETWPKLAQDPVMQRLDRRIAQLIDVDLANIEHGYIQSYKAGFDMHNMHMDQNPSTMNPARVFTMLIYLDDQPPGSGHTVFPLAEERGQENSMLDSLASAWQERLNKGIHGRDFFPTGKGSEFFVLGRDMCERGLGVRPKKGSAFAFFGMDETGKEIIEAVHGSCFLTHDAPPKNVLVKIACDGPVRDVRYFRDEL